MKAIISRPFFQKHGKKVLILYLCWCLVKGLVLLFIGLRFLD